METRFFRFLLFLLIFLCTGVFLPAQDANYFSVTENGVTRFYQRLAWKGGEYALRYEVVIERFVNGRYVPHLSEFTTASFIEVSLSWGDYRFQVIPYDILNRPEDGSPWVTFEVRHAIQPSLQGVVPGSFYESLGGEIPPGYVLGISGSSLDKNAEVFLRKPDGTVQNAEVIGSEGDSVTVYVDNRNLPPGNYRLILKNPGGLESAIDIYLPLVPSPPEIVFEPEPEYKEETEPESEAKKTGFDPLKAILVNCGIAWKPFLPLHGTGFGSDFSLLGLGVNINAVFYVPLDIYLGPELTVFGGLFENEDSQEEAAVSAGINLAAMKWFVNQRFAVNFRMGASMLLLTETEDKIMPNFGASFLWRFTNKNFIEAGLDYACRLDETAPDGIIRFSLGYARMF